MASPPGTFDSYILSLSQLEGGYTNDPDDPGGETCYGVTAAMARSCGYTGTMATLPRQTATDIYRTEFWIKPTYDRINTVHPPLGEYLFEAGVNLGPQVASQFLQRALNILSDSGVVFSPLLKLDGALGPISHAALSKFLAHRDNDAGHLVLLGVIRALAVAKYVELAESDPALAKYEYGWLRARALSIP